MLESCQVALQLSVAGTLARPIAKQQHSTAVVGFQLLRVGFERWGRCKPHDVRRMCFATPELGAEADTTKRLQPAFTGTYPFSMRDRPKPLITCEQALYNPLNTTGLADNMVFHSDASNATVEQKIRTKNQNIHSPYSVLHTACSAYCCRLVCGVGSVWGQSFCRVALFYEVVEFSVANPPLLCLVAQCRGSEKRCPRGVHAVAVLDATEIETQRHWQTGVPISYGSTNRDRRVRPYPARFRQRLSATRLTCTVAT